MNQHHKLNYVEFAAHDFSATKDFFAGVFGWEFTSYGKDYMGFFSQGLNGGFYQAQQASLSENGGALLIFYSDHLRATRDKITAKGGKISKDIFEFPGGFRFHFTEPSGNEFGVWAQEDH